MKNETLEIKECLCEIHESIRLGSFTARADELIKKFSKELEGE